MTDPSTTEHWWQLGTALAPVIAASLLAFALEWARRILPPPRRPRDRRPRPCPDDESDEEDPP